MWLGPPTSGGEPGQTIHNKIKVAFVLRPHEREAQPIYRLVAHKSLGGPWTSVFKMEMGNYAQNFYCFNFVHTILCKLIG